jgi:hypothetical protein
VVAEVERLAPRRGERWRRGRYGGAEPRRAVLASSGRRARGWAGGVGDSKRLWHEAVDVEEDVAVSLRARPMWPLRR